MLTLQDSDFFIIYQVAFIVKE